MKYLYFRLLVLILILQSCVTVNLVKKSSIEPILSKDVVDWSLDECNTVLDFYGIDNVTYKPLNLEPIKQKVLIKVLPLNTITVQAIAKKETIEKRLTNEDYYSILKTYLDRYTSYTYDSLKNEIVVADTDFTNGYSFKMYFENTSDPYEPIFLEDGYSYFFLENMNGDFSRVMNVSGLFVEQYFQLDDYLNAIIKFSPFSDNGKRLFNSKDLNENYRLVFNGLQKDSIVIEWKVK